MYLHFDQYRKMNVTLVGVFSQFLSGVLRTQKLRLPVLKEKKKEPLKIISLKLGISQNISMQLSMLRLLLGSLPF